MKIGSFLRAGLPSLLCLLAACSKSSRFDDKADIDACGIVAQADAENILGPLIEPANPGPETSAGACSWRFTSASGDSNARLVVMMATSASYAKAGYGSISRWFETNMSALKAMIDLHPKELKDLGDRAFLFGASSSGSAILMRQSQTFILLRMDGGSSSQLESFARILAREIGTPSRKAIATQAISSADAPRRTTARDAGTLEKQKTLVLYTMGHVEECIRADELLRKACDRWAEKLSANLRQSCDLPAATFEARTADTYRVFKETFREQIAASEPALSTTLAEVRSDLDRQFAAEVAGNLSGLDVERLSRLGRECSLIENEWLQQTR